RQLESAASRRDLMNEAELQRQSREFLRSFVDAAQSGNTRDIHGAAWTPVRDLLARVSKSRAQQGFSPSETAIFVFSLREPLFAELGKAFTDARKLAAEMETASSVLDALGLYTTEVYQTTREEVIKRQQQELLELSTPVVTLWDGILALPLIGT